MEPEGLLKRLLGLAQLTGVGFGRVGGFCSGQAVERRVCQVPRVSQRSVSDEFLGWMIREPAFPFAEQFVDLFLADPVMLPIVEHWDQHVEVPEKIPQSNIALNFHIKEGRRAFFRERRRRGVVSKGREKGLDQSWATGHRNRHDPGFQGQRLICKPLAILGLPCHGLVVRAGDGDREQRIRDIGPVVDVVGQQPVPLPFSAAHHRDWIHIEVEEGGRFPGRGGGVKDQRLTYGYLALEQAIRMLAQQEPQVAG